MATHEIKALSNEVGEAGDMAMVAVCERALRGDREAIAICERVISDTQAMAA